MLGCKIVYILLIIQKTTGMPHLKNFSHRYGTELLLDHVLKIICFHYLLFKVHCGHQKKKFVNGCVWFCLLQMAQNRYNRCYLTLLKECAIR